MAFEEAANESYETTNSTGIQMESYLPWVLIPTEDSSSPSEGYALKDNPEVIATTFTFVIMGLAIYLPIAIYFIYPLFIRRKDIILKKRYVALSLLVTFFLCIGIAVRTLLQLYEFRVNESEDFKEYFPSATFYQALSSLDVFSTAAGVAAMASRFWLIWFDINYSILLGDNLWKGIIDETWDKNSNFFLKYRHNLGNFSFLMKFVWINWSTSLIFAILMCVLMYLYT